MAPLDDFDSLLKGAADRYNNPQLAEQTVSKMIDERLIASRKRRIATFRKEIIIIIVCIVTTIFSFYVVSEVRYKVKPELAMAVGMSYMGAMIYFLASMFLFIRLIRISLSPKGTDIREYITGIYQKTQRTVQVYLWISTVTTVSMVVCPLIFSNKVSWYWILLVIALFGSGIHYSNIWYVRKRFGERLGHCICIDMMEFIKFVSCRQTGTIVLSE